MKWIKDEEFIRGSIPMTKFEVRMVTMGLLEIQEGDVFLDIGAGTGSLSIQAALQGAEVYSVEAEGEGVSLIYKNAEEFGANINIINACAPQGIDKIPPVDKCFIGGSGGRLKEILKGADRKLKPGGILGANFITLHNLQEFQSFLKDCSYEEIGRAHV